MFAASGSNSYERVILFRFLKCVSILLCIIGVLFFCGRGSFFVLGKMGGLLFDDADSSLPMTFPGVGSVSELAGWLRAVWPEALGEGPLVSGESALICDGLCLGERGVT